MAWDFLLAPILGAVGGITTQVISYKNAKLQYKDKQDERVHNRSMREMEHSQAKEILALEQAGAERTTALEGDINIAATDLGNLNKALDTLPQWSGVKPEDGPWLRWFKTFIEALQTLTRVGITLYFAFILPELAGAVLDLIQSKPVTLTDEQISSIYLMIIRGFVELAGLAVGFWFGSRGAKLKQQFSK